MEEKTSNVGLQVLEILMNRHYSSATIDNVAGTIVFSKNPTEAKRRF